MFKPYIFSHRMIVCFQNWRESQAWSAKSRIIMYILYVPIRLVPQRTQKAILLWVTNNYHLPPRMMFSSTTEYDTDKLCKFFSAWLMPISFTLNSLGMMLGQLIVGFFSDVFGRKPAIFVSVLIMVVANQASAMVSR